MSSAICLIYLATEYSWHFLLVSAFWQPHGRQAVLKQGSTFNRQRFTPFSRNLHITYLFSEKKTCDYSWSWYSTSCSNFCGVHEERQLLLAFLFSAGTLWSRERRKEEGEPCTRLLSPTPPGTCSDLCGDLAPSSLSLMRFLSAPRRPHQIPGALQELFGRPPVAAWSRLDCRDCLAVLLSCGVGSGCLSMAAEIAEVVSLHTGICFLLTWNVPAVFHMKGTLYRLRSVKAQFAIVVSVTIVEKL